MKPLSISKAAALLGVHPSTIWRCIQYGTLPAMRVGRVYRIAGTDFDAFKSKLAFTPKPASDLLAETKPADGLIDRAKPAHTH